MYYHVGEKIKGIRELLDPAMLVKRSFHGHGTPSHSLRHLVRATAGVARFRAPISRLRTSVTVSRAQCLARLRQGPQGSHVRPLASSLTADPNNVLNDCTRPSIHTSVRSTPGKYGHVDSDAGAGRGSYHHGFQHRRYCSAPPFAFPECHGTRRPVAGQCSRDKKCDVAGERRRTGSVKTAHSRPLACGRVIRSRSLAMAKVRLRCRSGGAHDDQPVRHLRAIPRGESPRPNARDPFTITVTVNRF